MGLENGSISFRMFYIPHRLPPDYIKLFAKKAAPPVNKNLKEPIHGWVSGRHLLDREITDENAFLGGYLRLTLMKAEKKVPESLLKAECKIQELAELRETQSSFLKKERKIEIKKEVMERLLPEMPPTLTGISIVYDDRTNILYASSISDKQTQALMISMRETIEKDIIPLTPRTLALQQKRINEKDLPPVSFSPELEDSLAGGTLGQDFLTWLWFYSEVKGGTVDTDRGRFTIAIQDPLIFVREGEGAHEIIIRKGSPLVSGEVKIALLNGKKLTFARIIIARDKLQWECGLDANHFIFRSLKLPKGQPLDPVSKFQERMLSLDTFREAFTGFFDLFLENRASPGLWKSAQKEIHKWVSDRIAKR